MATGFARPHHSRRWIVRFVGWMAYLSIAQAVSDIIFWDGRFGAQAAIALVFYGLWWWLRKKRDPKKALRWLGEKSKALLAKLKAVKIPSLPKLNPLPSPA